MNKLEGRTIRLLDGREGVLGHTIIKLRSGWLYFAHVEGRVMSLLRGEFEYYEEK